MKVRRNGAQHDMATYRRPGHTHITIGVPSAVQEICLWLCRALPREKLYERAPGRFAFSKLRHHFSPVS